MFHDEVAQGWGGERLATPHNRGRQEWWQGKGGVKWGAAVLILLSTKWNGRSCGKAKTASVPSLPRPCLIKTKWSKNGEKWEKKTCFLLNRPAITALQLVFHSDHFWCVVYTIPIPGHPWISVRTWSRYNVNIYISYLYEYAKRVLVYIRVRVSCWRGYAVSSTPEWLEPVLWPRTAMLVAVR